jgi:hypothetical protein
MTQYTFNVNGQSAVGKLTWNANGTLNKLAVTDPFNTQDNQTCTNTYDDLARVSGNNCGSTWAQTFSFDAFGNVSKSGSISWACAGCYTSSTNQYDSTLSSQVSYDANGNLLNDTFNTYTWDAYGNLAVEVGWSKNESILCNLSIFNAMTYQVALCRNYQGLWFGLNSVHSFDLKTKEAKKLL